MSVEVACSLIVIGISVGLLTGALFRAVGVYLVSNAIIGAVSALIGYLDYSLFGFTLDQLGWVITFSLIIITLHLVVANLAFRAFAESS